MVSKHSQLSSSAKAKAGIQYAAASRFYHKRLGLLDRPVKPGDDSYAVIANRPTDLPDGQISELAVQPPFQKYFPSRLTQIKSISIAVPPHTEGRFAIVTDVGAGFGGR